MNNVAETILKKNTKNINNNDTIIKPVGQRVLLKFYEDNPYRQVETTDAGVILGAVSSRYKSNETGEMEDSEEYIACAKVIAIGDACRYVKEGDDVFTVKHIATPIPYRNETYRCIDEINIICVIQNG